MTWAWIQFGLTALLLVSGVLVMAIAVFGTYRFRYVLNRMHAASLGDTLGTLFVAAALMAADGFTLTSAKLAMIVVLFWLASPVSAHLVSLLEVTICARLSEHCDISKAGEL